MSGVVSPGQAVDVNVLIKTGTDLVEILQYAVSEVGDKVADGKRMTAEEYLTLVERAELAVAAWQDAVNDD